MKIATLVANYLLGLVFFAFGIIFFTPMFNLDNLPKDSQAFMWMDIMVKTGFMHVVKGLEVVTGLMMLVGFRRPLAYVLAAPIVLNITFFHIFIMGEIFPVVSIVLIALVLFLLFANKDRYQAILSA